MVGVGPECDSMFSAWPVVGGGGHLTFQDTGLCHSGTMDKLSYPPGRLGQISFFRQFEHSMV